MHRTTGHLVVCLCVSLLLGCASASERGDVSLLDFLSDGVTTRRAVILKLGEAAGVYDGEKFLTYRLGSRKNEGYVLLFPPGEYSGQWLDYWAETQYSLVLVFDKNGILKKHSLVWIR